MSHYFDFTLEELGHASTLDGEMEIDYSPGEPMVRYYRDGSGYPGSPPTFELVGVHVEVWTVADDLRPRGDGWLWDELDAIAKRLIEADWDRHFERFCEAMKEWAVRE